MHDRVLLLIPAFNEAATLGPILTQARSLNLSELDILVVDDGSADETSQIAGAHRCQLIRHEENIGYGAALQSGFSFAHEEKYDYVVTLDADGQHRVEDVPRLLHERGRGRLVSGSRYLPASIRISQPPAPQVNQLFAGLINVLTDFGISDVGCGLKCIDVNLLKRVQFTETGYLFPIEFWWVCHRNEVTVREVPVPMIYWNPGRSIHARYGSVEAALDQALFLLLRLTLNLQTRYSQAWGPDIERAIRGKELPENIELIFEELQSTKWCELPLDSVRANLRRLEPLCRRQTKCVELSNFNMGFTSC